MNYHRLIAITQFILIQIATSYFNTYESYTFSSLHLLFVSCSLSLSPPLNLTTHLGLTHRGLWLARLLSFVLLCSLFDLFHCFTKTSRRFSKVATLSALYEGVLLGDAKEGRYEHCSIRFMDMVFVMGYWGLPLASSFIVLQLMILKFFVLKSTHQVHFY